jgi:tRNA pseudouridine55 synthase
MNRLFVAKKPPFISSNRFLGQLKRKYGVKKAGYSGTLDPFAKGTLVVAFGHYTRLFQYLNKAPKTYRATLWLGAHSDTLDIEGVQTIETLEPIDLNNLNKTLKSFEGVLTYVPPKYSAKRVNGKRAYTLARNNEEVSLPTITSTIYAINLIHYSHPFVTFDVTVSEGSYIRSIGSLIASKLNTVGSLSYLYRLNEGIFKYDHEKSLDPLASIDMRENEYLGDINDILLGKKLNANSFKYKEDAHYKIVLPNAFSIIQIDGERVKYHINRMELC